MTPDRTSTDTELDEVADAALAGTDLQLGYPTSEEPVVECDRIDIPEGEVTSIVGPNGSGKSTLLRALSSQLEPDAGYVRFRDRELQSFGSKELARNLGILSQENRSVGDLTVESLVAHGRYPHRGFLESLDDDDHAAIDRALSLTGIEHLRANRLDQLSGGQKQLAWIAMVLAQETDVLLLDEPTTFLDLYHQHRVLETIRQLNDQRDVTIAVVLHDIAQATRFADYLIVMKEGRPYEWGPPGRVVTEQLLADVFSVEATVERTPELRVFPQRSLPEE